MTRKKVLIVDDAKTVLLVEQMMLKDAGYDVVMAHDGEEALAAASREHPDLIVLDVIMPRMNGFETCRRLREREETKRVPIIMVTTHGKALNVEIGFRAGCTDYLTKPFNAAQLLTTVRHHLGGA